MFCLIFKTPRTFFGLNVALKFLYFCLNLLSDQNGNISSGIFFSRTKKIRQSCNIYLSRYYNVNLSHISFTNSSSSFVVSLFLPLLQARSLNSQDQILSSYASLCRAFSVRTYIVVTKKKFYL